MWVPLLLYAAAASGGVTTRPCPSITVAADAAIELTAMEKRLVCGDQTSPAWREIPPRQAAFFLRSFLQQRGYYHPTMTLGEHTVEVVAGPATRVSSLTAPGAPSEVDVSRYWSAVGKPLTPKLLNDADAWVRARLKANGYACPKVEARGDPETGAVTLAVTAGPQQRLLRVDERPVDDLLPGVLRRYDAFEIGATYDEDLIQLTTQRTIAEGTVFMTRFTPRCTPDGVVVEQTSEAGLARTTTIGVGFNTEQYAIVKGTLRNSRVDDAGSVFNLTTTLARDEQDLDAQLAWYLSRSPSRWYLLPSAEILDDKEPSFNTREVKLRLAPAATYDSQTLGWRFDLGPEYDTVETLRGPGPAFVKIIALEGNVTVKSHDYERFEGSPRQGFMATANGAWSKRAWHSQVEATRLAVSGEGLWNVARLDPPWLVAGWRGGYATTLVGGPGDEAMLPPPYRHYLGGSTSVRGFARLSLPGDQGALTTAFSDVELRLASLLPQNLQPFVFADVGATGHAPMHVDQPLFLSPGLGMRWQSPVGPIRVSAARGFVKGPLPADENPPTRWAFYFSFGQEF